MVRFSKFLPRPIPGPVRTMILREARREWPDDRRMQRSVIDEQHDAYRELGLMRRSYGRDRMFATVENLAEHEWPDDYVLRLHLIHDLLATSRSFHRMLEDEMA